MQETTEQPTLAPEATDGLSAAALRAETWAGEPFLHPDEDPAAVLAPGTARRRALDDALAEIEAGRREPSYDWKIRYALMLGLERVLSQSPPRLASGTELRRHQIDALAGMLTELIAATQVEPELNGNGADGRGGRAEDERRGRSRRPPRGAGRGARASAGAPGQGSRREPALPLPPPDRLRQDDRRRGLRRGRPHARRPDPHPPPAARHAVQPRADGRGLRRPLRGRDPQGQDAEAPEPRDRPDLRLVRAPLAGPEPGGVQPRDRRRGAHRARREDEPGDPQLLGPDLHRHDGDRAADREAGLRRLPRLDRRAAARRRRAARADRAAALPARAAGRRDLVGADRRRRLRGARAGRGARPHGAEPGRREPLPRPLREHARDRLRRGRRARVQPGQGVPRGRAQGRGGQRPDAARAARRDARRLRARRDQHPDQRDAARRGLELTARDRLHAPRPDRLAPRLPAADRPDHAHAPAQGGRRRRSTSSPRARRTTSASSRCTACWTPTSTARARASPRRRGGAFSGGPGGSSRRRRGSCPSRRTSSGASP